MVNPVCKFSTSNKGICLHCFSHCWWAAHIYKCGKLCRWCENPAGDVRLQCGWHGERSRPAEALVQACLSICSACGAKSLVGHTIDLCNIGLHLGLQFLHCQNQQGESAFLGPKTIDVDVPGGAWGGSTWPGWCGLEEPRAAQWLWEEGDVVS